MANVKINDLAVIADPASTDVLPIVDVTLDTTNKISIADILKTAPEGTAAAPAIAFEGDSNTGIYHPGSEQIAFSTSGVGRVFIASDGNIGVGTASPDYKLQVSNNNDTSISIKATADGSSARATRLIYGFDDGDGASINATRATSDTAADVNLSFRTGGITNSEERMRIASSGNVGIGTSNPGSLFSVLSPNSNTAETIAEFGNQTIAGGLQIETNGNLDWGFNARNSRNLTFSTNQDEAARIDSSGRLLVGTSSVIATPATLGFAGLQVAGTGTSAGATNSRFSNNTKAPFYEFAKSRGTTLGTQAVVGENDQLGTILFSGSDGSAFVEGARIRAQADGTPGANDMPGRLVFSCTIDGASSPTEHFRIANDGTLTATDTTIGSNSDSRLKTNVADFVYSLEDFKQYQPKTFDWKNPGLHGNQTGQRGFIAQDVENIDGYWVGEQAVEEDSEDAKFLNEDLLAKTLKLGKKDAMYVSVIQQLLAKIETLEQRLTDAGI